MNSPGRNALEKAVLALLQPKLGYFSDHAVITCAMPIAIWRERMQSAIETYVAASAAERKPAHRNAGSRNAKPAAHRGKPESTSAHRNGMLQSPIRSTPYPEMTKETAS
jgi:hypothetical protein